MMHAVFPTGLQTVVEGKSPGTKVVILSDFNEDDEQLFQKEHAEACPGLARSISMVTSNTNGRVSADH